LLAGAALTIFGIIDRGGIASMAMVPGLMLLWAAAMVPGDSDVDHQRRQQLMRELAEYSTPAQQRDLTAVLDRYPDGVTGEIREILASQGPRR
jgi:non-ribosomal peptide synthetase component E (peptide arylation enzyme)